MMICDADFDELFPSTAPAKRPAALRPSPGRLEEASLGRLECDRGQTDIRRKVSFIDGRNIVLIEPWRKQDEYA